MKLKKYIAIIIGVFMLVPVAGQKMCMKAQCVKTECKSDVGGWNSFPYPKINFVNESLDGNGAIYKELIPDAEKFIQETCYEVCRLLYENVDDIQPIKEIDYRVFDYDGVSAKEGHAPKISITFSSSYLAKSSEKLSKEELFAEIKGVLIHELTHGYQPEPRGIGDYGSNKEFWSFIEGEADAIRIKAGYVPFSQRKAGGHWLDGYKTTGFFINWLETQEEDFIVELNCTCEALDTWGWDKIAKIFFNRSIEELWGDYQSYLASVDN